ncbi:hypothetical protein K469DRAFT_739323 [Zopfia rhizophila CBS 207.26]|uniref:Uncharacterized protein n=1 Tax=Zopfia rhizophila CBS 207.26 TaxID=1314779 RepID=A0A6A6DYT3_9PEZI|nr:hypothetical protein K469DRAFT_739323 [Zopfia rhizophila CBS 207.26]
MAIAHSKLPYSRIDSRDATLRAEAGDAVELTSMETADDTKNNAIYQRLDPPKPHFPWPGVAALISIVLLTVAAVGVLLASSGSPIDRWQVRNVNVQPQVWLSVLTTIMDGVTMFALMDAAAITYWQAAAHGTTLRKMYDLYESHTFLGALNNVIRLRVNKVAVASILCLVSALRGPLFQRASLVMSNVTRDTSGEQELRVAQLIPPGFIYPNGTQTSTSYDVVYDAYIERAPIHMEIDYGECGDVCDGKVKAYGFDIKCSNLTTIPWDDSENSTVRDQFQYSGNRIGGAVPSFNSSAYLQGVAFSEEGDADEDAFEAAENRGWFDVVNLFKTEPVCGGELSVSKCSLHHAVVEYAVDLRNGTMSLLHDHWQDDTVLFQTATWKFAETDTLWGPTTQWAAWYTGQFNQEVSIYPDGDNGPFEGVDNRFLLAKRFINGNINAVNCSTTFSDPTQFVLDRLREMAFRTAVAAGNVTDNNTLFGLPSLVEEGFPLTQNWTQKVALAGEKYVVTYSISIPYLVCAGIASLLAVVAIAPFYWNWREMPVSLSFNPLDVANAFDAPLLQDAYCEKTIQDYVRKESGLRRLKYSARASNGGADMLSAKMKWEDK